MFLCFGGLLADVFWPNRESSQANAYIYARRHVHACVHTTELRLPLFLSKVNKCQKDEKKCALSVVFGIVCHRFLAENRWSIEAVFEGRCIQKYKACAWMCAHCRAAGATLDVWVTPTSATAHPAQGQVSRGLRVPGCRY